MSNKENLLLRIKAVQALDHTTYASYLRRDVSHLPDQPEVAETVRRLDEILNK